ncbi:MAG: hypothetical protein HIU81_02045 [Acidobacteria bacterium]|nr:hypothetical protein [Acidobacteriota bacterium]
MALFPRRNRHNNQRAQPPQVPDIGRRRLLAILGTTAVVTAFRANIAADYLFTERTSFRVTTPDNQANRDAAQQFPGAMWYLFGGFQVSNRDAGRKLAALQPAMNTRAPASYIGYSNDGIDVAQLFIAIQRDAFAKKINTVYLYGDSFGGMVSVVLAPLLEQNGIHVKLVVFGSSPSSVVDVEDPNKGYISVASALVPYLGFVGRLGYGAWQGLANPNGQNMYTAARDGISSTMDPNNNSLLLSTSQGAFLNAFPRQYDGGVSPSTTFGLIYDPKDFVVNADLAIRGWRNLLPKNLFFQYDVPHTGHASPEIHPNKYRTALGVILDVLAPLPHDSQHPRPKPVPYF